MPQHPRSTPDTAPAPRQRPTTSAGLLHVGAVAGLCGATAVALWFLVADVVAGHPFATPARLGAAVGAALGANVLTRAAPLAVLVYTFVHYAAFIALGVAAALVARRAQREPSVLAGAFLLFVVAEVAFHGLVALLPESAFRGTSVWLQIAVGNLIAAAAMGAALWRAHPELRGELAHALGGGGERLASGV